jgi:polyisoprenoid-binding protein YceI
MKIASLARHSVNSILAAAVFAGSAAVAAPVKYDIDPAHTYPSFEVDHMGGLSTWRGKFNATSGTVTVDKEAGAGTVDVKIDTTSIDFGHDKMNTHSKSPDMLDVEKFPTATYTGKLTSFKNGAPTQVDGTLELHGVSKPVKLKVTQFLCKQHPMTKKDVCGADATGTFNRDDFGVGYGKQMGFKQDVTLRIQVEAAKAE